MRIFRLIHKFYEMNMHECKAYIVFAIILSLVTWLTWLSLFTILLIPVLVTWVWIAITEFMSWNSFYGNLVE